MLAALVFVFYLLCTSLVSERLMGALEGTYQPPENPQGDCVIMLGGGAFPDTPDVSGLGTLCSSPANRLLTAKSKAFPARSHPAYRETPRRRA